MAFILTHNVLCTTLNFIETCNPISKSSFIRRLMSCSKLNSCNWVSISQNYYISNTIFNCEKHFLAQCCILLNFMEVCNSYSKIYSVRRFNVWKKVQLLELSVFLRIISHHHCHYFWETITWAYNAVCILWIS
jgi:hypothetical protein